VPRSKQKILLGDKKRLTRATHVHRCVKKQRTKGGAAVSIQVTKKTPGQQRSQRQRAEEEKERRGVVVVKEKGPPKGGVHCRLNGIVTPLGGLWGEMGGSYRLVF